MTDPDYTDLNNWLTCPWCRSDKPANPSNTDAGDTEVYVHEPEDGKEDGIALSVHCRSCGTDVSWLLEPGEEPEAYAHD